MVTSQFIIMYINAMASAEPFGVYACVSIIDKAVAAAYFDAIVVLRNERNTYRTVLDLRFSFVSFALQIVLVLTLFGSTSMNRLSCHSTPKSRHTCIGSCHHVQLEIAVFGIEFVPCWLLSCTIRQLVVPVTCADSDRVLY